MGEAAGGGAFEAGSLPGSSQARRAEGTCTKGQGSATGGGLRGNRRAAGRAGRVGQAQGRDRKVRSLGAGAAQRQRPPARARPLPRLPRARALMSARSTNATSMAAVMLEVVSTMTFGWRRSASNWVSSALTARIASDGSDPLTAACRAASSCLGLACVCVGEGRRDGREAAARHDSRNESGWARCMGCAWRRGSQPSGFELFEPLLTAACAVAYCTAQHSTGGGATGKHMRGGGASGSQGA